MDNNKRLVEFLESSFLSPLLGKEGVTDISFNGEALFYQENRRGRRKADIKVTNEEVGAFLRQIANFSEHQFSYLSPIMDVFFGHYRLNATFFSIGRVFDKKAYSFALRIGHEGSAITKDRDFFPPGTREIILDSLSKKESIVIAGETGCGKTELQKYLLSCLEDNTHVIVIDNIEELEFARSDTGIDLTSWRVDPRFAESDFPALIRNALRNNPDYLVVAEARGEEMYDALRSVMSGHPIIMTLHALDIQAVPHRMARMASIDPKLDFKELLNDIYHHFGIVIFLSKKKEGGCIQRRVAQIARFDGDKQCLIPLFPEPKV